MVGTPPYYRTGNKNARNIYLVTEGRNGETTDTHIGCVFDPTDGEYFVAALNAQLMREREAR
jgi:hypothetical protein